MMYFTKVQKYIPTQDDERAWEIWYGGPEELPYPTNIWVNESNLKKAFLARIKIGQTNYTTTHNINKGD
jgi:hypothetical protein